MAHETGREVTLLQWDVARPVFEAHPAAARFPMVDSITQPVIRRAVGLWAREAVAAWDDGATAEGILLVEAPLVGWRLVELIRSYDDAAGALLASDACRFVLPVPTEDMQRRITEMRQERAAAPTNASEREDAPPRVLDAMWRLMLEAGAALGLLSMAEAPATYDAAVYQQVYERLLRHRHIEVLNIDTLLPPVPTSVYEFDFPVSRLVSADDVIEFFVGLAETEMRATGTGWLDRWWEV